MTAQLLPLPLLFQRTGGNFALESAGAGGVLSGNNIVQIVFQSNNPMKVFFKVQQIRAQENRIGTRTVGSLMDFGKAGPAFMFTFFSF